MTREGRKGSERERAGARGRKGWKKGKERHTATTVFLHWTIMVFYIGMVSKPEGQVQKTGKAIAKGSGPALHASRMQRRRHDAKHLPFGIQNVPGLPAPQHYEQIPSTGKHTTRLYFVTHLITLWVC